MDYLAQHLISSQKRLLAEIASLRKSIDTLRDQQERHHQTNQAEKHLPQPPLRVEAEVQEPPAIVRQKNLHTNRNLLVQAILAAGTLLTFVSAAYYAGVAKGQLGEMKKAATAAEGANVIANNSLVLGQRPWIKIKHRIIKPLDFGFVGAGGPAATMTVEDTIENVGNSVALNVISWEDVIPLDADLSTTSARKRRDEWCNANKKFDPKSLTQLSGYTLFPHDPSVQSSAMGPLMKTVEQAVKNNMANMKFLFNGNGPNPLMGKLGFAMVGCVVYRSQFDSDGTRPHVTGFLYHLGEPVSGAIQPFVLPHGTASKLQLVKFPDGDFAY